jgi:hypothetical protein
MMFKKSSSVPANTTSNDPSFVKLRIAKGTITEWIVFSPEEAADLLQLRIFYHGSQIFPFSPDEWYYGVFVPLRIPDEIEIKDSPYELDIIAINSDDTFPHDYHVQVVITPETPVVMGSPQTQSWLEKFRNLFQGE